MEAANDVEARQQERHGLVSATATQGGKADYDESAALVRAGSPSRPARYGVACAILVVLLLAVIALSRPASPAVTGPSDSGFVEPDPMHGDDDNDNEAVPSTPDAFNGTHEDELAPFTELADEHFKYTFNCSTEALAHLLPGTAEYDVRMADCGAGYDFAHSRSKTEHIKIALWGEGFEHAGTIGLSGCPVGGNCGPLHPHCFIEHVTRHAQLKTADVVVITAFDAAEVTKVAPRRTHAGNATRPFRVLYWREPYWPTPSHAVQQEYDFNMGIHYFSGVVNPVYLRRPHMLLGQGVFKWLPFVERKSFALSIISDCHATSQRQYYIDHLVAYLGHDRVHQYGRCGTRSLPPPPVTNAARTIEKYKFFLAFENTIMPGYVTEKLFTVLNMGIVPVYLGAPDAPNITVTPSFIRAADFGNPKELAEYLLHLDAHPDEYMRYHAWRTDPNAFDPAYLDLVARQMPGQTELHTYRGHGYSKYARRAACCRLCDENMLERAKANHKRLVGGKWRTEEINHRLFQGKMMHVPTHALLKPVEASP